MIATKASLGRIVHVVMGDDLRQQHRPAIVVRTWGENGGPSESVNLQVFLDGSNDNGGTAAGNSLWMTSVPYSAEPKPRTWHWPERE